MTHPPSLSDRDAALAEAIAGLDAYGGDPARWSQRLREAAASLAGDPGFEAARRAALDLDALLDIAPPRASEALQARILAGAPARPAASGSLLPAALALFAPLRRMGSRLLPAGAVAGLSALGFAAGILTAPVGAAAQDEALLYAGAAIETALGEETPFWENEQ